MWSGQWWVYFPIQGSYALNCTPIREMKGSPQVLADSLFEHQTGLLLVEQGNTVTSRVGIAGVGNEPIGRAVITRRDAGRTIVERSVRG